MLDLKIIFFGEKRLGSNVDSRKYRIVPTWLLVIVLVIAMLSLVFEVYAWVSIGTLAVIEVDNTIYVRGEPGYALAMSRIKSVLTVFLWISGLMILGLSSWLFFRIRGGEGTSVE